MKQGLPRGERIQKTTTFSQIRKKGKRRLEKNIIVWSADKKKLSGEAQKKNGPLLGIGASKKFDKRAARRNLFKRRVREVFRKNKKSLPADIALFIQARQAEKIPTIQEIKEQLWRALEPGRKK